jgi:diacylglycerol kinase
MNLSPAKLLKSFGFAFNGLKLVLGSQQNFWIHLVMAFIVIATGVVSKLTAGEWCILTMAIFLVLAMEVVNTAVEKLVDFISPGFHEQAGIVKDISAAAVLLSAIGAVIVGLVIFLPRVL